MCIRGDDHPRQRTVPLHLHIHLSLSIRERGHHSHLIPAMQAGRNRDMKHAADPAKLVSEPIAPLPCSASCTSVRPRSPPSGDPTTRCVAPPQTLCQPPQMGKPQLDELDARFRAGRLRNTGEGTRHVMGGGPCRRAGVNENGLLQAIGSEGTDYTSQQTPLSHAEYSVGQGPGNRWPTVATVHGTTDYELGGHAHSVWSDRTVRNGVEVGVTHVCFL